MKGLINKLLKLFTREPRIPVSYNFLISTDSGGTWREVKCSAEDPDCTKAVDDANEIINGIS